MFLGLKLKSKSESRLSNESSVESGVLKEKEGEEQRVKGWWFCRRGGGLGLAQ